MPRDFRGVLGLCNPNNKGEIMNINELSNANIMASEKLCSIVFELGGFLGCQPENQKNPEVPEARNGIEHNLSYGSINCRKCWIESSFKSHWRMR